VTLGIGAAVTTGLGLGIGRPRKPFKIAFSPNGEHVYVLDQMGSVSEISFANTAVNV
jgi:DNA-binding beta-propeller fold protein YncE